ARADVALSRGRVADVSRGACRLWRRAALRCAGLSAGSTGLGVRTADQRGDEQCQNSLLHSRLLVQTSKSGPCRTDQRGIGEMEQQFMCRKTKTPPKRGSLGHDELLTLPCGLSSSWSRSLR